MKTYKLLVFTHTIYPLTHLFCNILLDFFPLCIVWSPIPCLTWLVPVIGHLGIYYHTDLFQFHFTPTLLFHSFLSHPISSHSLSILTLNPHSLSTLPLSHFSLYAHLRLTLTTHSSHSLSSLGIASSDGYIYDFAGSYYIHVCEDRKGKRK